MKRLLFLNGPNLNLLGLREPEIYGALTLADIEQRTRAHAAAAGADIDFRQHNAESDLIEAVHTAQGFLAIILNAAAYTHTSLALHDAVRAVSTPVIELHLSNVFARETFRHHSYIAPAARGVICGFGADGYLLAVDAALRLNDAERG